MTSAIGKWGKCTPMAILVVLAGNVARAELILYYNLNEGAGTNAADQSASNNDGAVADGWTTGVSGSAATIASTGVASGVTTSNSVALGSGDFAISLWFKGAQDDPVGWRFLVTSVDGSWAGLVIATNGNRLRTSMGPWFRDVLSSSTVFGDDAWYNLVVVRDGTALTLYVNGAVDGTGTSSATIAANPIIFGSMPTGSAWTGAMDDIAVWNVPLTTSQVAAIASGTSPLAFVPEPLTTLPVMTLGLVGLLCRAWRRRR